MKTASYNVKGLSDYVKLKSVWSWILESTLDVLCLQEHKLHNKACTVEYCHGFTLFYCGFPGKYSGTLTIVMNSISPHLAVNHVSGRCLGISVTSPFSPLVLLNIYGCNTSVSCNDLWYFIAVMPSFFGLVCGDFNMVLQDTDSTTRASMAHCTETSHNLGQSTIGAFIA